MFKNAYKNLIQPQKHKAGRWLEYYLNNLLLIPYKIVEFIPVDTVMATIVDDLEGNWQILKELIHQW